jgi:ATP-dependent Clp protease adaptor protein ClpS
MAQKSSIVAEPQEQIETGLPAKVILFNDDYHTFDEVIAQIIKAIRCSIEEAEFITWEAHTKGRAVVTAGELEECLRVSRVLEEIGLQTQIEI